MKILAIDTSTSYLSLAVIDENKILCEVNKNLRKPNHCRYLLPYLKEMLDDKRLKIQDLDVFCVGLGPGSFTGLRVGLATIKGLNLVCNKKLVGISSMDAIAHNIENRNKIIACIQDAKKGKVYGCLYKKNNELIRLTDYLLLELKELLFLIKKICKKENKNVVFTADGVEIFKKDILKSKLKSTFAGKKKWYPKAAYLAREALKLLKMKKNLNSPDDIEPLYLHSQYANITKPKRL